MALATRLLHTLRPSALRTPLRAPRMSLIAQRRTYATPIPGPTSTPESLAYVVQFRQRAHAVGYDADTIARLMDAEVAAGRMPPDGPRALRALGRLHTISVVFLVVVMGAMLMVPIARHGRNLLPGSREVPEKKERIVPRPRRLGERDDSQ
ncbi:hypothetical protein CspeluHIS016_0106540 [Cutaneotrichosporon spelunceum]|uniref:Uncharacterized protein n=1 Tax=Cutaneotrichosporon spelunceum TaxID=1672016 RepID=A0AAD3Y9K0_9TREE|nr:hypothetical protein CspeluHIS016_0106540 [Cutaneotrichosporon spelunceum]